MLLSTLHKKIIDAEIEFSRESHSVLLLAASKSHSSDEILKLYQQGQRDFGENYLSEALEKIKALSACNIRWHYIGPIQSNKTRAISEHFSWVHSVASFRIAKRLNEQRPQTQGKLNVCIQVNLSNENSKQGIELEEVESLCEQVTNLKQLRLRGLMAIPKKTTEFDVQRACFAPLRETFEKIKKSYDLDTLSIGMSGDYRAAIAEGATFIRLGTALFGERLNK